MDLVTRYPWLASSWQASAEGQTCREALLLVRTWGDYDESRLPDSWWHLATLRAVELQLQMRRPSGTYIAGEVLHALG